MTVEFKKGQVWNKPKNKLMLTFEKEKSKNAVYRGVITGGFEAWLYKRKEKEKGVSEISDISKPIEIKEAEPIELPTIDIFPAKFLKVNQNLQLAINKLFSYNVNFLNPESSKQGAFDKIIIDTICPSCKSIMNCSDCFNKKSLKVTYERICHECNNRYVFTCKYENKEELKKRYKFFVENIYKVRAGVKNE